ncbi:MAG: DUF2752 domain-containing protein [Eubacterium sp.]|nr:DUF2752 domain-containing protein [Eubacterium sp.]
MTSDKKDLSPKEVRKRTLRDVLILALVGILYYVVVRFMHLGMACYIHYLTGYYCPMCGSTRMIIELTKFNISKAFHYNPFMFISLPYVIYEVVYLFYICEAKKKAGKVNQVVLFIWTALLAIFGIVRNIVSL